MNAQLPGVEALGDLSGRRVLLRVDLNVPLSGGEVSDDARIRAVLPTLHQLSRAGARVVVLAHLGRPGGQVRRELSLAPVARRLAALAEPAVHFAAELTGAPARRAVADLPPGQVLVLENLRFHSGETARDDGERAGFADSLAELGDAYVGDAFGVVHRKHASVYDLPLRLPHAAGSLVLAEVAALAGLVEDPVRPYVVVLGGSKVSDKLGVIAALIERVDKLLIGGGMCFSFLAAVGGAVGASLVEPEQFAACRGFRARAAQRGVALLLPVDVLAATDPTGAPRAVVADAIPPGLRGLDIGPHSVAAFEHALSCARTVFWNGPMGVYESPAFASGTAAIARAVAGVTKAGGRSVVGGGDSAAAVHALGLADSDFGHVSTGGGAALEYLQGRSLPGLLALGR